MIELQVRPLRPFNLTNTTLQTGLSCVLDLFIDISLFGLMSLFFIIVLVLVFYCNSLDCQFSRLGLQILFAIEVCGERSC